MKKLIATTLAAFLLVGAAPAASAQVDLSGMSLEELVELKDQVDMAIWQSAEWQEVEVPQGVWEVGRDIPAGKWTISCNAGEFAMILVGNQLEDGGAKVKAYPNKASATIYNPGGKYFQAGRQTALTVELTDGDYVEISVSTAIFSPYSGKALAFR